MSGWDVINLYGSSSSAASAASKTDVVSVDKSIRSKFFPNVSMVEIECSTEYTNQLLEDKERKECYIQCCTADGEEPLGTASHVINTFGKTPLRVQTLAGYCIDMDSPELLALITNTRWGSYGVDTYDLVKRSVKQDAVKVINKLLVLYPSMAPDVYHVACGEGNIKTTRLVVDSGLIASRSALAAGYTSALGNNHVGMVNWMLSAMIDADSPSIVLPLVTASKCGWIDILDLCHQRFNQLFAFSVEAVVAAWQNKKKNVVLWWMKENRGLDKFVNIQTVAVRLMSSASDEFLQYIYSKKTYITLDKETEMQITDSTDPKLLDIMAYVYSKLYYDRSLIYDSKYILAIGIYLKSSLEVENYHEDRLNKIVMWLWRAGRPPVPLSSKHIREIQTDGNSIIRLWYDVSRIEKPKKWYERWFACDGEKKYKKIKGDDSENVELEATKMYVKLGGL